MEEEIMNILRSFGWIEGFHIPVANEENRLLESKLDTALKKKQEVETLLQDTNNNFISLRNYYKNIIERRAQNEQMLVDYRKQIEVEEQNLNELRFEKDRLNRDTKNLNKETTQLIENNQHLQTEIQSITRECDDLKKDIEWSKEMDHFLDENLNEENSIITLLEEYNLQDNIKFEQTELTRQKLVTEFNEYQLLLNQKETEISSSSRELEKLSKLLESTQKERQWLVEQWGIAVRILRARDAEIENITREMNILMEVSRHKESKMLEHRSFFKELKRNNMEVEINTRCILRESSNQQQINDKLVTEQEIKINQLTDSRKELNSLGDVISEERTRNTQLKREINIKKQLTESLEGDLEKLSHTLKNLKNRLVSSVDRIKQLELIFQSERKQFSITVQQRQKMDRSLQSLRCKQSDLDTKCAHVRSELKQMNKLKSKLKKTIQNLEEEIDKHVETSNSLELQIAEVNSKIHYLKEDKSNELKLELDEKLIKLTADYNEKKSTLDMIRMEVNKCNNEIKTLNKEINSYIDKMKGLKEQKEHLDSLIEADEKHLTKITEENKEKEVNENLLRLRASQLEKAVNKTGDVVFSLEKQKVELETLLRERLLEIGASSNLLRIRKKALLAEISTLKRSIDQIDAHTSQLMKKYEIIMDNVGKDERGDSITITNYKIQLVKERYSLLEKGDDLDEKIRKAEKEIRAMENTRLLMNTCNKTYKESISPIDQNSKEYKEKEKVETEYNHLLGTFRKLKQIIPDLKSDIEELKIKSTELQSQDQHLECINREKKMELSRLEHEVNEQHGKLDRVETRIKTLKKSLKASQNVDLLERDYLAKELQNINKTVLSSISDLITNHPETESQIIEYLSQKGIDLPNRNVKRKSRDVTPSELSSQMSTTENTNTIKGLKNIVNIDATSFLK